MLTLEGAALIAELIATAFLLFALIGFGLSRSTLLLACCAAAVLLLLIAATVVIESSA